MTESSPHGYRHQYRPTNSTTRALERDLAVVLAAHGSSRSRGSGDPVYAHARRLRERPVFDEVRVSFWQEEPSFAEALRATTATHRFVVPLFVSEGYFTRTVLPRELDAAPNITVDDVTITRPVGTAPAVTDLIASRALEACRADDTVCDLSDVAVAIIAHGAENDPRSAVAATDHVERLRRRNPKAVSEAFYLEEPPYVSEVLKSLDRQQIVAVPLFVGRGDHVTTDVPELLGFDHAHRIDDTTTTHVGEIDGRNVRYTEPIGTHPALADVIVRRVLETATGVNGS
ncbi:CbiX/SirB N-terminal domain-containing protein [Natronolimnohabitans sp. A-GB9]|uniref:CbiX/SirB N-terminal domain-containing protein n=1 Tax=Natronolimnohabitans sp. A-GB9 TaxID=3069757 RepID=UPI0027B650F7|nr:CbiX/SirB N-terminal domain-containing protein [Natronolimnohabitans sp. A-GB9]MDQ2051991.1 CbiX/SirB N-terminal domain-containing protein [Natronolimnohabitans sp. A-GB9]